ncbi:MAG: rod shape-determining protein MreD [Novosphingobium sp.]|nr:rod shape-determining protein MreD [Novosphingobium sp.]
MFSFDRSGARRKINRAPSPLLARSIPWLSVMLASILPSWLVIASAPVLPPLGFLVLISWMQLRPGLLPAWAGLPLGLFDDLYSGQPLGSAILLWSVATIMLEFIEVRLPWRNFLMEGLVASGLVTGYIVFSLGFANIAGASTPIQVIVPQIVIALLVYPMIGRFVSLLDRFRLLPFMVVG